MIYFLTFMSVWIAGCAFVDHVVPDIANSLQMLIGFVVGTIGVKLGELLETKYG